MSYEDILCMIMVAGKHNFGHAPNIDVAIQCATQIYLELLKTDKEVQ